MTQSIDDLVNIVADGKASIQEMIAVRDNVVQRVDTIQSLNSRAVRWSGSRETQGVFSYLVGNHAMAVSTLRQEASTKSSRMALGMAAVESSHPEVALEALKGYKDPEALAARARAYLLTNDIESADKEIEGLQSSDASQELVQTLRAERAIRCGDIEGALELVESILAKNPESQRALFLSALLADRCGEDELAIERYERIAQKQPIYVDALLNLGILYEDRGEFDHAIRCYHSVLKDYPTNKRARLFLKDAEASLTMYYDEDRERKEDRRMQVLRTPVSDFELSVRSRNCLQKMNIETLGDLIQQTEQELLAYKNFGETSLQEIKAILASKGLRLGMGREEALKSAAIDEALEKSDPKHEGALAESVDALDLSVRARKCMERMGIRTVGELTEHSEQTLLSAPNFGTTSLIEVKRKLAELGLSLST